MARQIEDLAPAQREVVRSTGPGQVKTTDHDCGPGKKLVVFGNHDGSHRLWCFRCGHVGSIPAPHLSPQERLRLLHKRQDAEASAKAWAGELPEYSDRVPCSEWPKEYQLWFLKCGISLAQAESFGVYFAPRMHRVVLPLRSTHHGGVVWWQARTMDAGLPKYIGPVGVPSEPWAVTCGPLRSGQGCTVLTEDILSSMKVALAGFVGVPVLGTTLRPTLFTWLATQDSSLVLWFDGDGAGQKCRLVYGKALRTLTSRPFGSVYTPMDPKTYSKGEIIELINTSRLPPGPV